MPPDWTFALATIDLPTVKRTVIAPFLDQEATAAQTAQGQQQRKGLTYLIGLLRDQDATSHDFLMQRCIRNTTDPTLAAVAIDALARLADRRDKPLLERLAAGSPSKDEMPHFKGLTLSLIHILPPHASQPPMTPSTGRRLPE